MTLPVRLMVVVFPWERITVPHLVIPLMRLRLPILLLTGMSTSIILLVKQLVMNYTSIIKGNARCNMFGEEWNTDGNFMLLVWFGSTGMAIHLMMQVNHTKWEPPEYGWNYFKWFSRFGSGSRMELSGSSLGEI